MTHDLAALREALEPFAKAAESFRPDDADTMRPAIVQAIHFRRARQALAALEAPAVDQGAREVLAANMDNCISPNANEIAFLCRHSADLAPWRTTDTILRAMNEYAAARESAAVERERERCAKLAEDLHKGWQKLPPRAVVAMPDALEIAAAIRAGGA